MKTLRNSIKRTYVFLFIFLMLLCTSLYLSFNPTTPLRTNSKIDNIVVYKSKRQLLAYSNGQLIKMYKIALGKNPIGEKQYQGDNKTPEGVYSINGKNANSIAYKNLGISYPNKEDVDRARKLGKPTGGDIKIHGIMNGFGFIGRLHICSDWTNGCIAVTDREIDELFKYVKTGTKIEILP